jgi:hypothetical protein
VRLRRCRRDRGELWSSELERKADFGLIVSSVVRIRGACEGLIGGSLDAWLALASVDGLQSPDPANPGLDRLEQVFENGLAPDPD